MVGIIATVAAPGIVPVLAGVAEVLTAAGTAGGAATATAAVGTATTTASAGTGLAFATAGTATTFALGPLAIALIGASSADNNTESVISMDCWKPLLHDKTSEPSSGRVLKEILLDSRIKKIRVQKGESSDLELVLRNVWDEDFAIDFVLLPTMDNQVACHARKLE